MAKPLGADPDQFDRSARRPTSEKPVGGEEGLGCGGGFGTYPPLSSVVSEDLVVHVLGGVIPPNKSSLLRWAYLMVLSYGVIGVLQSLMVNALLSLPLGALPLGDRTAVVMSLLADAIVGVGDVPFAAVKCRFGFRS